MAMLICAEPHLSPPNQVTLDLRGGNFRLHKYDADKHDHKEIYNNVSLNIIRSLITRGVRKDPNSDIPSNGINAKIPEDYQLMVLDLITSRWLSELRPKSKPRSRLLVADEGGLGKTYSTALAIRQIFMEKRGIILILCPPLLKYKWRKEIRHCLRDLSSKVNIIKAKEIKNEMADGVYIISKFQLMNQYISNGEKMILPEINLTVIDEIHQGQRRTELNFNTNIENEEKNNNIEMGGPLWKSQKEVCNKSSKVIGLTASPYQMEEKDILSIFMMMGGEMEDTADKMKEFFNSNKDWPYIFDKWNKSLEDAKSSIDSGPKDIEKWFETMKKDNFEQWQKTVSWMDKSEKNQILKKLLSEGKRILSKNPEGFKMIRELHPFGRFFSIVTRDDLGPLASKIFRDRTDCYEYFKLDDEHKKIMKKSKKNKISPRIIHSAPENINNERYLKGNSKTKLTKIKDGRIDRLINIISEETKSLNPGKARGVIIFVDYHGTVDSIEKKLFDQKINKEQIFTLTGESEEKYEELNKAKKYSLDGNLPVLICTSAAETGVDMEWATVGVIWDIGKNPESLQQRTWRLDRRRISNSWNGKNYVVSNFKIFWFITDWHVEKEIIEKLNLGNKSSSSMLAKNTIDFIPKSNKEIFRKYSEKTSVFAISNNEAKILRDRFHGISGKNNKSNYIQVYDKLEILFWQVIRELMNLRVDMLEISENGILTLEFLNNKDTIRKIYDLSNMSTEDEMKTLWHLISLPYNHRNFSNFYAPRLGLMTRNNINNIYGLSTINRNGTLSFNIGNLLIKCMKDIDFISYSDDEIFFGHSLDYYSKKTRLNKPHSILVNPKWLNLYSKNNFTLRYLGIPSPIIVSSYYDGNKGMKFLEDDEDWEEILSEAIDFCQKSNYGPMKGEPAWNDKHQWPKLNPNDISRADALIEITIEKILDKIDEEEKKRGGVYEVGDELKSTIINFEKNVEKKHIIPVLYFGEDV